MSNLSYNLEVIIVHKWWDVHVFQCSCVTCKGTLGNVVSIGEPWGLGERSEHVSSLQVLFHTYVHPNLRNITLLDVTPSLMSQNPRDWMFSV